MKPRSTVPNFHVPGFFLEKTGRLGSRQALCGKADFRELEVVQGVCSLKERPAWKQASIFGRAIFKVDRMQRGRALLTIAILLKECISGWVLLM